MAGKLAFTPASLDALNCGKLDDPLTPGLFVQVRARGRKRWTYRRRVSRTTVVVTLTFGHYPATGIAGGEGARGHDGRAHELYMIAVREGRASSAKRPNKPRTIADKLAIYRRDIAPKLASRIIYDVTEDELIDLVEAKRKKAEVRANRVAAELKVFFGWAASLRGREVGLKAHVAPVSAIFVSRNGHARANSA